VLLIPFFFSLIFFFELHVYGPFHIPPKHPVLNLVETYLQLRAIVVNKSPYSLLGASFGVVKWPVIQTLLPRACLTGLSFCQPFLINHAITLSQEAINDVTTQRGYGLIGAYFFVYVGIAVSLDPASPIVLFSRPWFIPLSIRDADLTR
jgi:hypothetical protein